MKTEDFSNSLNNVNDKYIEEAVTYKAETEAVMEENVKYQKEAISVKKGKSSKGLKIWRAIAIAACAVLVVGIGFVAVAANLSMGGASKGSRDYSYAAVDEAVEEENVKNAAYYETNAAPAEGSWDNGFNGKAETSPEEPMSETTLQNTNNKIIYRAYLSMETKEFDKAVTDLESLVNRFNGYLELEEVNNNSSNYRFAYYTIRIPAERLDEFLFQAGSVCTVRSSNKSAEDVSEYYFDTETRLETARTKLARLQELLAQAATMEDIIELEREISDTEYTIDSYTSTLKQYDSLIDYSTVTIDLQEVYKTSSENQPLTFGQRLSNSFKEGLRGFGDFLEDLVVWLACSWIWLVIVAAIVVVIVVIIKRIIKKKKTRI